jgi:Ca2+:H+ antiporter
MGGLEHATSLPPSSSSTDHARTIDESIEEADAPEKPIRSNEPINVSQEAGGANEDKPRQRRKFLGMSRTPSQNDDETEKPVENKQKFTVVGQLKATIFNSWINILLIAVPVGSTRNP